MSRLGYKNLKLLYQGSKDGFDSKVFHKKVDGVKGTLVLVKPKEGLLFGGYTFLTWEGNGLYKTNDESAFIFSVNKNKIHHCIN